MISRTAKELYILADHTKIRRRHSQENSYGSCAYDKPCTLITDDNANMAVVEYRNPKTTHEERLAVKSPTEYAVVQFELNGKETIRRCNINSSGQNTFQAGDTIKLYFDSHTNTVLEKGARIGVLAVGIFLAALGVLAGASILSVIV